MTVFLRNSFLACKLSDSFSAGLGSRLRKLNLNVIGTVTHIYCLGFFRRFRIGTRFDFRVEGGRNSSRKSSFFGKSSFVEMFDKVLIFFRLLFAVDYLIFLTGEI